MNRKQEDRIERQTKKSGGLLPLSVPEEEVEPPQTEDTFKVDEYKDMLKGSFDTGDPLTTNLYVGNINPKVFCSSYCSGPAWASTPGWVGIHASTCAWANNRSNVCTNWRSPGVASM